jgi:LAS superfamily LD-carboxypeptidase LdcB
MFRPRLRLSLLLVATGLLVLTALKTVTSIGQTKQSLGNSTVKPTADIRPTSVPDPFLEAAAENSVLRNGLKWVFGGKEQRGWSLYTPLIQNLINTPADPDSAGFAEALVTWQKKKRLSASGVLDEQTWMAMVAEWQARRLKDKAPALPEQLTTAPVSQFYDVTRAPELRMIENETLAAYRKMLAAAIADKSLGLKSSGNELAADEKYLKVISSFRSREYQDELRRKSPNAGSAGLAINSPHFTGRALDLYVGGKPVETNDANRAIQVQTKVYQWLVKNAERFGFRPYYYEPWHWEYVR